jgi:hypothetical protein
MPLPYGNWTANANGLTTPLRIDAPDQQGVFTGQIFGTRLKGFWNEAAQSIQFTAYAQGADGNPIAVYGFFEGHLLRTPPNPADGQDVQATLVGCVVLGPQAPAEQVLPGMVATARRSTFGWMANITELN